MQHLHFVVPSALVDPDIAADLLRGQAMPNLQRIARFAAADALVFAPDAPLTPWQAYAFGARGPAADDVDISALWAMVDGLPPSSTGGRYIVEPAHYALANDHLRLDDPARLAITPDEARALARSIEPVLADAGWRLAPIDAAPTRWWATRDDGATLIAPAIERAIGDNVAAWQPRADGTSSGTSNRTSNGAADPALAWRRCVNEIQMLWFAHPVNDAREADGRPTINTVWLSGLGLSGAPGAAPPRYASIVSGLPLVAVLPTTPGASDSLESFDDFVAPTRAEDWSGWRDALARFDARLGALAQRVVEGSVDTLTMVLCGRDRAMRLTVGRRALRRRWRAWFREPPLLVDLLSDGDSA